jgi:hypothetical protein
MSSIWDYPNWMSSRNLVGHDVEAIDGHIGTVDEASNVVGRAHLVVDTGSWTLGTKRLIPSGFIQRIDDEHATVHVGLTKEQVKSAPDLEAKRRNARNEYDAYFEPFRQRGVKDPSIMSVVGQSEAPAHD